MAFVKLLECCVWCWGHNCQKVTSKRKMQNNKNTVRAMEKSKSYLKRMKREIWEKTE